MKSAQANAALFTKMQYDQTLALGNIATATQANITSVALLTKTILELSTQFSTQTAKLATSHSEIARLKNWDIVRPQLSTYILRPVIRPLSDHNMLQDCNLYSRSGHKFEPNRYWSSHGFKVKGSHTSVACRYPGNDHNKFAMRLDTTGGNIWNKEWINSGPTK